MSQAQIDYTKMSTEELALLAHDWASGKLTAEEPTEDQPRDEQGRFVPKKEDEKPAEQEEVIYERTIDLGDGSGVQVFEGKSMEELIDKLAKAQENATRKIREQAAQIKSQPKTVETPSPDELENLTEAEKFLLQQEMLTDPAKAIQKFVVKAVEQREQANARAAEQTKTATETFVANTSDYYASPKNGKKMVKWLETHNLEVSEDNLKQAFEDLNESGLLEARPAEATSETPVETEDEKPTTTRIESRPVTQTVVRRKVVGGVSVKRSAPKTIQPSEPDVAALEKMPMHELEALTRKALLG